MIKADFELYAPIKGFEGLYEVSTWGNVKSLDRWVVDKNGSKHFFKGRMLKGEIDKDGYLRVALSKNSKHIKFFVHRLVAIAFIPNPDILPEINHKDEVPNNNYRYNLEWCTRKYNNNFGNHNKKVSVSKSKKVYQYDLQGNLIKVWLSTREVGKNGFRQQSISACCLGNLKTHKGYIWSYTELA